MLRLGVLILLQVAVLAITITVSSEQERCMIVSSNDHEQFLKIDLKFEAFPDQTPQEGYRIVLHNTETHEEEAFQVFEGAFRREFKLVESKFLHIRRRLQTLLQNSAQQIQGHQQISGLHRRDQAQV